MQKYDIGSQQQWLQKKCAFFPTFLPLHFFFKKDPKSYCISISGKTQKRTKKQKDRKNDIYPTSIHNDSIKAKALRFVLTLF